MEADDGDEHEAQGSDEEGGVGDDRATRSKGCNGAGDRQAITAARHPRLVFGRMSAGDKEGVGLSEALCLVREGVVVVTRDNRFMLARFAPSGDGARGVCECGSLDK